MKQPTASVTFHRGERWRGTARCPVLSKDMQSFREHFTLMFVGSVVRIFLFTIQYPPQLRVGLVGAVFRCFSMVSRCAAGTARAWVAWNVEWKKARPCTTRICTLHWRQCTGSGVFGGACRYIAVSSCALNTGAAFLHSTAGSAWSLQWHIFVSARVRVCLCVCWSWCTSYHSASFAQHNHHYRSHHQLLRHRWSRGEFARLHRFATQRRGGFGFFFGVILYAPNYLHPALDGVERVGGFLDSFGFVLCLARCGKSFNNIFGGTIPLPAKGDRMQNDKSTYRASLLSVTPSTPTQTDSPRHTHTHTLYGWKLNWLLNFFHLANYVNPAH